jgi:hypothetical protein
LGGPAPDETRRALSAEQARAIRDEEWYRQKTGLLTASAEKLTSLIASAARGDQEWERRD